MSMTNADAMLPQTMLNFPRFHGPALKRLPTKNTRMKIGMVKATKAEMAPTEKSAPIATGPAKISNTNKIPMTVLNHTALTGVLVFVLTWLQYLDSGKQPSRAYANVTRDAA